jgi:hypothetical protein
MIDGHAVVACERHPTQHIASIAPASGIPTVSRVKGTVTVPG